MVIASSYKTKGTYSIPMPEELNTPEEKSVCSKNKKLNIIIKNRSKERTTRRYRLPMDSVESFRDRFLHQVPQDTLQNNRCYEHFKLGLLLTAFLIIAFFMTWYIYANEARGFILRFCG
uniref:Uncharacterized protein n=1 Tax=Lepeophtheirus salmonis TaxID=72036 RepID=A0A0K2UNG2_LEPSM